MTVASPKSRQSRTKLPALVNPPSPCGSTSKHADTKSPFPVSSGMVKALRSLDSLEHSMNSDGSPPSPLNVRKSLEALPGIPSPGCSPTRKESVAGSPRLTSLPSYRHRRRETEQEILQRAATVSKRDLEARIRERKDDDRDSPKAPVRGKDLLNQEHQRILVERQKLWLEAIAVASSSSYWAQLWFEQCVNARRRFVLKTLRGKIIRAMRIYKVKYCVSMVAILRRWVFRLRARKKIRATHMILQYLDKERNWNKTRHAFIWYKEARRRVLRFLHWQVKMRQGQLVAAQRKWAVLYPKWVQKVGDACPQDDIVPRWIQKGVLQNAIISHHRRFCDALEQHKRMQAVQAEGGWLDRTPSGKAPHYHHILSKEHIFASITKSHGLMAICREENAGRQGIATEAEADLTSLHQQAEMCFLTIKPVDDPVGSPRDSPTLASPRLSRLSSRNMGRLNSRVLERTSSGRDGPGSPIKASKTRSRSGFRTTSRASDSSSGSDSPKTSPKGSPRSSPKLSRTGSRVSEFARRDSTRRRDLDRSPSLVRSGSRRNSRRTQR
eukprot:Sspe_Gene.41086::Locus_19862_Transcript_1_2_Confidence_0.800_Length_1799::g.41086::m.41086